MILVFDVGNTNIVLGIFKGEELVTSWRTATDRRRTADDLGMLVKNLSTSVVSPLKRSRPWCCLRWCRR